MLGSILEQSYRPSEGVLLQSTGSEAVLLDLRSNQYFGLDEVGTRIWSLVAAERSGVEIAATIANEFEVDRETARVDLARLLAELEETRLIRRAAR